MAEWLIMSALITTVAMLTISPMFNRFTEFFMTSVCGFALVALVRLYLMAA